MTAVASRALMGDGGLSAGPASGGSSAPASSAALLRRGPATPLPLLPAELVAVDEATGAALAAAAHADEWDAGTRAGVLAWVARHRDVLAVFEGKVLTAERDAGTWSLRGDRDLAGFVGRTSHQGRGAGLAAVGQAGTLAALPAVAQALVDGPVTTTHVAQITRATAGSAALAAELATPAGQAQVVELAGRLDGAAFGKALAQLSASLDPSARQRSHDEQRAQRFLLLTHTPSGTVVKGRLDSIAGRELGKALDALSPRPGAEDDRSRQQRHADALTAMARRVLTDPHTTPDAVAPVQGLITFTQDTWTALRAARDTAGETPVSGSALDVVDRLRGVDPVIDESGQPWPASEVARALCDCALTWAVVGTPATKLDLGRESRLFKRQHWLALYAAGVRTCAVGGCAMPLAYTELHHIAWWVRDHGRTTPTNCAPYCSFHHHEIHRLGILITRQADGTLEHRYPDGRPYGAPPGDQDRGRSLPTDEVPPLVNNNASGQAGRGPTFAAPRADAGGGEDPPPDLLTLLSA